MKAVLFDLDQTLLDRSRSLQEFLEWQCRGMLGPYLSDEDAFIRRFLELDANGTVWKDHVYTTLIAEFALNSWSATELLSVYENCFGGFCLPMAGAPEAVNQIASLGCDELGAAPSETVFVGDNPIADVEGAKAAELRTVFIPSKLHPECPAGDLSCAELSLLPEIIGNFGPSGG